MLRTARVGSLLKRSYRILGQILHQKLQARGFTDLRPSFLEILIYICENEGTAIKNIGRACYLKKQTMTSHLNELERRGYIKRVTSTVDKRESHVFLTAFGEKFKATLQGVLEEIEKSLHFVLGDVEFERLELSLEHFLDRTSEGLPETKAPVEGLIDQEEVSYWT